MNCRNCSSEKLELVIDLGMQPWGNNFMPIENAQPSPLYPLEAFFCNDCTMVQLGYTVPKETMFVEHNYVSGTTNSLKKHFKEVGDEMLKKATFTETDYVLDIGGNDGTFLSLLKDRVNVLNVDSGVRQAELSNASGVECLNTFFDRETAEKILAERGHAKAIHGSGVFFHLEELHSVFAGIKLLLAPDGLLVAEFIYLADMVRNGAYDQIYHEHLLYYTIHSFNNFLIKHDLMIHDVELLPIHGGSCIAYISHRGTQPQSERLKQAIADEIEGGFHTIELYKDFAGRIEKMRDDLVGIVKDLKSQGKSIQAMGAPVKGSTILNYCNFTHEDLDCAVEINRLKCNTYFPGTQIPVYHQDEVTRPDAYLLLSWNFQEEILAKLGDYRDNGGKIISPLPQPELI
jgi:hypothetical protein